MQNSVSIYEHQTWAKPVLAAVQGPAKPCVYVGMTGLAVQERFQNHKAGRKAARIVKNYGIGPMPELLRLFKSDEF